MTIALSLVAMVVAFALIWRGYDVRAVLFGTALGISALVGQSGVVFRKVVEALTDARYVLPICGAMGFAYVVRETGCVDDLVSVLLRPLARVERLVAPGSSAVAFVVNTAIPSQTSTLATVGPLAVALMASLERGTSAIAAGTTLVLGASIAGELLNPGVPQVIAVAGTGRLQPTELVVWLVPAALAALVVGLVVLNVSRRFWADGDEARLAALGDDVRPPRSRLRSLRSLRALLPILPVVWLMAGHPSLPSRGLVAAITPAGLEIFSAMMASAALTIVVAARDRTKATRVLFDGMGFAFAQIVSLIAVSAGIAKALEVAGVLSAFVGATAGHATLALVISFLLAFALGIVTGSGVGPSVALVTALGPRAAELGVHPLALGGAIMFGAEAGRTTSPVAVVVVFGGSLVSVAPRVLSVRLALPCLLAGIAGALVCILRAG